MQVCDFARSFVTFVTFERANNARIQVEARCELTTGDTTEEYLLVASCKAERTYAEKDLFFLPNYDFCMIYSRDSYRIHRVPLPYDPDVMDAGIITDRFERADFAVKFVDAEVCEDNGSVVAATLANRILIGRTEIWSEERGLRAVIEYPIKTMNVHQDPEYFQVDTGPILLPDFTSDRRPIEVFDLAFVAWNVPGWAEFVIQDAVPACPDTPNAPRVCHYSKIRVMDARNQVLAYD